MAVRLHGAADLSTMETRLRELDAVLLDEREKGIPDAVRLSFGEIAAQRWNVFSGELPLPLLVVAENILQSNIDIMQHYCESHGVLLAPHSKTSMCPHIWYRQLRAGAWGMTTANIVQFQVARSFGVPRILLANEVARSYDVRVLAAAAVSGTDVLVLVDSVDGVEFLARELASTPNSPSLNVMVELGLSGGRTGARTVDEVVAVSKAVLAREPRLVLAGVEGYEGVVSAPLQPGRVTAVDAYISCLREAAVAVRRVLPQDRPLLVSAGGSMHFDRVVAGLVDEMLPGVQVMLRSGGYVTHDAEFYERTSPLSRGSLWPTGGDEFLEAALQLWAVALSRPEPDRVIVGFGRRDAPVDQGYPIPSYVRRRHETVPIAFDARITGVDDQHAYLQVDPDADVAVGDVIGFGVSHPCAAFDRWRLVFLVDEEGTVCGAARTFF